MITLQTLWNKFWRDKHGKVVLWQSPNIFLDGWVVAAVLAHLLHPTNIRDTIGFIGSLSLGVWAFWELISGVNYFRRALGLLVFGYIIISLLEKLF